jgi:hypothetical protein
MTCEKCASQISGNFLPCKYCSLSEKHKLFLETFLKCRGNIKEVERSLSISYPTVKGLLDDLLFVLFDAQKEEEPKAGAAEILDMLEKKEITAAKAAEMLAALKS